MYDIQILNKQTLVPVEKLADLVEALQIQIDRDFVPAYGSEYAGTLTLTTDDNGTIPLYLYDTIADAPEGALAWHDVDDKGRPFGMVPTKLALDEEGDIAATVGHELLEMLRDMMIDQKIETTYQGKDNVPIAVEDCDPVESDTYPITVNSGKIVQMTNFVLPAWFDASNATGPWDFLGKLTAPLTIDAGGYMQYQDSDGGWHQVTERKLMQRSHSHEVTRFHRRKRKAAAILAALAAKDSGTETV